MSTSTVAPATEAAPTDETAATPGEPGAKPDEQLGPGGLKALEAERAANRELRRQVAVMTKAQEKAEESRMSDIEKLQASVATLTERAERAEIAALRKAAISTYRLDPADEVFLTAEDKAGIESQAAIFAERLQAGTPKPDPTQGTGQATALNSNALEEALKEALGI